MTAHAVGEPDTPSAAPVTSGAVIIGIVRRQRGRAGLAAGCMAGHQICEALVPVAFGLVIERAVRTGDGSAMVISTIGILALFTVLTLCARIGHWLAMQSVLAEAHRLRNLALERLLRRRPRVGDRQTGEQLSIVTSDALASAGIISIGGWMLGASIGLTLTAVLLLRIDWALGLGILVGVPLMMAGLSRLGPRLERRTAAQQQSVGLAAGLAADFLSGMRPLRGFGGVPEAVRRYRVASRASRDAHVDAVTASAQFAGISAFSTGVLLALVGGVAGLFALSGRISIGELVTVVGLAAFLSDPIATITRLISQLAISRASAARVAELLSLEPDAPTAARDGSRPRLELHAVRAPGLDGLSLTMADGEIVGVVATTATTAASLVAVLDGSSAPESGTSQIEGGALVEPHAVHLFGNSLREALLVGEARSDAELEQALTDAALSDLAGSGRVDLDHPLSDHGLNLSGGQRQRIAMARALLADAALLVLRDPTTAVDAVTESVMMRGIRRQRERPGRMTVIITSSPPLLAGCDAVVFVDADGRCRVSTHARLAADADYAAVVLR